MKSIAEQYNWRNDSVDFDVEETRRLAASHGKDGLIIIAWTDNGDGTVSYNTTTAGRETYYSIQAAYARDFLMRELEPELSSNGGLVKVEDRIHEHISDVPTMNNTLTKFTLHPKVGDFGFIDFATILFGQIIGIDKPRLLFRVVGDQDSYADGHIIHTYDSACYVVVDKSELNIFEENTSEENTSKKWWEFWK